MNVKDQVAQALREELKNIGYGVGTINAGQLSDHLAQSAIVALRDLPLGSFDGWLHEDIGRFRRLLDEAVRK